jgi:DNA-binding NtrC family response regulator
MSARRRILLVDDEPEFLGALRRLVEDVRPGTIVVYACDVPTAEWQLQSTSLCYVFTDLRMQGDALAGLRVVEAARKVNVPVAVITATELTNSELLTVPIVQKTGDIREQLRKLIVASVAD